MPVNASLRRAGLALAVLATACQPIAIPPTERSAVGATSPTPVPAAPAPRPTPDLVAPPVLPSTVLPPGPIYFCDIGGQRSALELPASIESLCRRHPEMGPCQYERDGCRARSGRVYTSLGEEVTRAVETEYDRRVHRVRFQADGGRR
jgi:hypothetical protein